MVVEKLYFYHWIFKPPLPNYQFRLTLYFLEMSWAVVPSIVVGPIIMILGFRILDKTKQKLIWSGLAVFGYSSILLLQAIWATIILQRIELVSNHKYLYQLSKIFPNCWGNYYSFGWFHLIHSYRFIPNES